MKRIHLAIFTLLSGGLAVGVAQAQSIKRTTDVLPAIQMTQAVIRELRNICVERYPDLKPVLDEAYGSSSLSKIEISVRVNGKEYVSPQLESFVKSIRDAYASRPDNTNRKECEEYPTQVPIMLRSIPKESLAPFLEK